MIYDSKATYSFPVLHTELFQGVVYRHLTHYYTIKSTNENHQKPMQDHPKEERCVGPGYSQDLEAPEDGQRLRRYVAQTVAVDTQAAQLRHVTEAVRIQLPYLVLTQVPGPR